MSILFGGFEIEFNNALKLEQGWQIDYRSISTSKSIW